MKQFQDKTIIITGAAMGLGLATAQVLAQKGANLVLVDYNEKALTEALEALKQDNQNLKAITVVADVSDEAAVKNYVDKTIETFGRIDGFYNNAGIEGRQAPMTEYDISIFKKVIDI